MRINTELISWVHDFDSLTASLKAGADSIGLVVPFSQTERSGFGVKEAITRVRQLRQQGVGTYIYLPGPASQDDLAKAGRILIDIASAGVQGVALSDFGVAFLGRKSLPDLPLFLSLEVPVATLGGAVQARELGFSRVVLSPFLKKEEIKPFTSLKKIEVEFCFSWLGLSPGIIHKDWPFESHRLEPRLSSLISLRDIGLTAVSVLTKPDGGTAAYGRVKAARLLLDKGSAVLEEAVSIYHRAMADDLEQEADEPVTGETAEAPVPIALGPDFKDPAEQRLVSLVRRFRLPTQTPRPTFGEDRITIRASLDMVENYLDWLRPDNVVVDLDKNSFESLKQGKLTGIDQPQVILAFPETEPLSDWTEIRSMADELLWCGYRRWLVNNLDQLRFARSLALDELWAGWNLFTSNMAASALLTGLGCRVMLLPLTLDRRGIETSSLWTGQLEPVLCVHARPVLQGSIPKNVPVEGEEAQFRILSTVNKVHILIPRRPFSLTHYLNAMRTEGLSHFLLDLRFEHLFQRNPHGVVLAFQHASSEPGGTTLMYQPRPVRDRKQKWQKDVRNPSPHQPSARKARRAPRPNRNKKKR